MFSVVSPKEKPFEFTVGAASIAVGTGMAICGFPRLAGSLYAYGVGSLIETSFDLSEQLKLTPAGRLSAVIGLNTAGFVAQWFLNHQLGVAGSAGTNIALTLLSTQFGCNDLAKDIAVTAGRRSWQAICDGASYMSTLTGLPHPKRETITLDPD